MVTPNYEQLKEQYQQWKSERLSWWERLGMALTFTDELLDFLNLTMLRHEILLRQAVVYLATIAGLPPPPPPIEVPIVRPKRVTAEAQEIMEPRAVRSVGTHVCERMADCRAAIITIVRVESGLNQDIEIETIGNVDDTVENYTPIGTRDPCPSGDRIDIILYGDNWRPYVGIRVIAAVAPTAGLITARVINQE